MSARKSAMSKFLLGAFSLFGYGAGPEAPARVGRPMGFGEPRGIVNARRLGLSKHRHRADPAKKAARKRQRIARREQRRTA
jgi:hypothetical protein